MAARNDPALVNRTFASAKPFISHWLISHTGLAHGPSRTDGESLQGVPGTLKQVEWVSAAHNLTQALALAKGKADYYLILSPGMEVKVESEFRHDLKSDSYLLREEGATECWAERLVSDSHEWEYTGRVKSFIRSRTAKTRGKLHGISVIPHVDLAEAGEELKQGVYLLKEDLERGINVARCTFHLGGCYRDLGNLAQAIEWYEKRSTMGGWEEETWYSLYQVARLQQRMGISWILVLNQHLRAYEFRPMRAEPLYHIARFYRESRQWNLAYLFSSAGWELPYPDDLLFIDRAVYEYGLPLEHALCCRELGKHDEAVEAAEKVLASASAPEEVRELAEGCLKRKGVSGPMRRQGRIADSQSPIANVEYVRNGETVETVSGPGEPLHRAEAR
jgi:tetratricopeptide (TPR) repeat protein